MSDEIESTPDESAEQPTVAAPAAAEPVDASTVDVLPAATPTDGTMTTPPPARPGIVIPRWVALLVGILVVVLGSGAIGYAIGHDSGGHDSGSDDHGRPAMYPQYRGGPYGQYDPNGQSGGRFPGGGPRTAPPMLPGSSANGAFLGVSVQADTGGVRITRVASGSPADGAGLKTGDIVTALDGTSITSPVELVTQVQAHSAGDQVTVTYTRNGTSAMAKVTLGSRADSGTKS